MSFKQISVFLSYSNYDKEIAGFIKSRLDLFGLDVFLAHEDIEPSNLWLTVILNKLRSCDVFIPIITNNFKDSDWTDHETGFAVGFNKLIIPIYVDLDPYGFINQVQALRLNDNWTISCNKIIEVINESHLKEYLISNLLNGLKMSESFDESNYKFEIIEKCAPLKISHNIELINIFYSNMQVKGSFEVRRYLASILIDQSIRNQLDAKLVNQLKSELKYEIDFQLSI